MSVTPIDIRNAKFNTSMRGFNRDEVDDYLQNVAGALESVLQEQAELTEKYEKLQEEHNKLSEIEETLKSTLIDAKTTANSILQNAKEDAKLTISKAQESADRIESEARRKVEIMRKQVADISDVRDSYREKLGEMISCHLNNLQNLAIVEPDFSGIDLDSHLSDDELSNQRELSDEAESTVAAETADSEESENSDKSLIASKPIDQSQLDENNSSIKQSNKLASDVNSAIANAARTVEISAAVADSETPKTSESADNNDPELYRKLSEDDSQENKTESSESKEEPKEATAALPHKSSAAKGNGSPAGSDGILVFGRREDREKAVEENARVLSELDSVVDRFAEELNEIEPKSA